MIAIRIVARRLLIVSLIAISLATGADAAQAVAASAPIKEVLANRVGWNVNSTKIEKGAPQSERNTCTTASGDKCQNGQESSEPGGFSYPTAVAVDNDVADLAHYGHVYVADKEKYRVQELTANGEFVSMFGWDVNKTKTQAGAAATQEEKNICTEEEIKNAGVTCGAGTAGKEPEMLFAPASIAIDPSSGEVYVAESSGRIAAYTSAGKFLWTVASPPGFDPVAAGGPEHLLYVGSENTVQELEADGKVKREVPVKGDVSAIAVDNTSGEMYVLYDRVAVVHRLEANGVQLSAFTVLPRQQEGARTGEAHAIALDSAGHLAVSTAEEIEISSGQWVLGEWFGSLYEAKTGRRISLIRGVGTNDMAFSGSGELYVAASGGAETGLEVIIYEPLPIGELVVNVATSMATNLSCLAGVDQGTDAVFDCTLIGLVDPWGVSETQVWFEWGKTESLGKSTKPPIPVPAKGPEGTEEQPVEVSAPLPGLKPNERLYYRIAGEDHNIKPPELFTSEITSLVTPAIAPRVIGTPTAEFVHASSAVIYAQINPENTTTRYRLQYAPETTCSSLKEAEAHGQPCPGTVETPSLESAVYGKIGATREASGLQPATAYRYQLLAVNKAGQPGTYVDENDKPDSGEGTFTTASAPFPIAQTGGATVISANSATISGNVNPDGTPAVYTFEVGIDAEAATRYGIVASGPVEATSGTVEETFTLTGLQPGTRYAYRISIASGYGQSTGGSGKFTTLGLPVALPQVEELPQLPVLIHFPPHCKHNYIHNDRGQCVRIKSKKKRKKIRARKTGRHTPTKHKR